MRDLLLKLHIWLYASKYRIVKRGNDGYCFALQEKLSGNWWWDHVAYYNDFESALLSAKDKRSKSINFQTKEFNNYLEKEEVIWP